MADATKTDTTKTASTPTTTPATDRMAGLVMGRIVEFCFRDREGELALRPAIVVRVWDRALGLVNLRVFTDGANDAPYGDHTLWAQSVRYSAEPEDQTWRWPEQG